MIALCTDAPNAEMRDGQFVITFPSGKDSVEIAMSLHHALLLGRNIGRAAALELDTARCAEIVSFKQKRGARRGTR